MRKHDLGVKQGFRRYGFRRIRFTGKEKWHNKMIRNWIVKLHIDTIRLEKMFWGV